MDLRFVSPDLRRFDRLRCEALALPVFSDERPFRGALGLVDWRMCGRLSALRAQGWLTAELGEQLLLPARPKLPVDKLFLVGAGDRKAFDAERCQQIITCMVSALTDAKVRASALSLPGRAADLISPDEAMTRFLRVVQPVAREHDEFQLIEEPEAQRAMEPVVERERRRARASTG